VQLFRVVSPVAIASAIFCTRCVSEGVRRTDELARLPHLAVQYGVIVDYDPPIYPSLPVSRWRAAQGRSKRAFAAARVRLQPAKRVR